MVDGVDVDSVEFNANDDGAGGHEASIDECAKNAACAPLLARCAWARCRGGGSTVGHRHEWVFRGTKVLCSSQLQKNITISNSSNTNIITMEVKWRDQLYFRLL